MVLSVSELDHVIGGRIATVVPGLAGSARPRGGWKLERYPFIDRGSYEVARDIDEPELTALALAAAARVTERSLRVFEARLLCLRAGDYLLARHDRVYDDFPVEVMLDLSPTTVPGAEVHYRRRGNVFFRFASQPGAASIVERGPTVTCNHTYVSKLHPDALVVRLVLLLRE
jgi:hypothetical protein